MYNPGVGSPLRVLISGSGGRMGRAVAAAAVGDKRLKVVGGVGRATTSAQLALGLAGADVLVDFSLPAPALAFAKAAAKARRAVVSGTTGFSAAQEKTLRSLSKVVPVFWSPNMSPGMNLLFELAARAAAALPAYDAAVLDVHHAAKKDAPSGTAKRLQAALGRPSTAVSLRVGDVAGDHVLTLAGPGERLELSHRAHSREVFARGALRAALWVAKRRPGFYSMTDLLR